MPSDPIATGQPAPRDRGEPGATGASASRPVAFFTDRFVLPLPERHRFPMLKYRRLRERLLADGVLRADDLAEPPAASDEQLALVHTTDYLRRVREGRLDAGEIRRIGFPWSPELVERSRRSVGATLAAARRALEGPPRLAVNLAGGTHHAFPGRGEGFCVFNDVAVAIRVLQGEGAIVRALVVDCDVHQGNGTASIFEHDDSVFTLSLHGRRNFPLLKERSDLDVELEDGVGDEQYLDALARALDVALSPSRPPPDLAIYLAGADPYRGDRLGRLDLSAAGLERRDRLVVRRLVGVGVPIVVTMAGGYSPDPGAVEELSAIHANTVRVALEIATASAPRRAPRGGAAKAP
ncbi:MAG: histone deacetylase [Acidobacteria bacterium]|nr:MAG: histone deacetylase [Acidobacteriota bacterium]REK11275.1 MAG: histone deacetylase [Acidobacteriota bacterium]